MAVQAGYWDVSDCEIVRVNESKTACVVRHCPSGRDAWIPDFAIHEDSEIYPGDADGVGPGTLIVREDIATKKGVTSW